MRLSWYDDAKRSVEETYYDDEKRSGEEVRRPFMISKRKI
jgi:hypothetical protein